MEKRLKDINDRLVDFSFGRFDRKIRLSRKHDLLDGISNAINMLGEELNEAVISKNYFNSIVNSVSDMIIILNKTDTIVDINHAVNIKLGYTLEDLKGEKLTRYLKNAPFLNSSKRANGADSQASFQNHPHMRMKNGTYIPVRVSLSRFKSSAGHLSKVFTATDISAEISSQKQGLRAIIDTQENERQRIAKDFHDTLIQQLTAIKFHLGSNAASIKNKQLLKELQHCDKMLSTAMNEVRNICFYLMPVHLKEFGLAEAVREFCLQLSKQTTVRISGDALPAISEDLKIDLYRVLQELVSNSIRHGNATKITIRFSTTDGFLQVILFDNGAGFDPARIRKGMGLQNIQSRINSHGGTFSFRSGLNKGTSSSVTVPIGVSLWHE